MLESIGSALKKATDKIARTIFVDKDLIDQIIKDLQRALISADVNIYLVKEISNKIKEKALDEKIKGVEKKEQLIKLLHDEVLEILGKEKKELELKKSEKGKVGQTKILLAGLYGAGKTTSATKLANYYKKRGKKVAVIGLDVHRPAAADQLKHNSNKIDINCFIDKEEKNALKIYKKYEEKLKQHQVVIIDTAGRHSLDNGLTNEIKDLKEYINPDYSILVIQADIGQAAKSQAAAFKEAIDINGVIITRMDSSSKAGGALTACYESKSPVFFIGTGEKINDFESFNPKSFLNRLLGVGDLESLLEKVESAIDKQQQQKFKKKFESGEFNLRDFQEQIKSMSGIGSFSKIAEMIPGFKKDKIPEQALSSQEDKMKKWNYIIDSMTPEEINNPELIEKQTSRLGRISKGSGTTTSEIRQLLKQYKMIKELSKSTSSMDMQSFDPSQGLSQKQLMKFAKKFGKKIKF